MVSTILRATSLLPSEEFRNAPVGGDERNLVGVGAESRAGVAERIESYPVKSFLIILPVAFSVSLSVSKANPTNV